MKYPLYELSSVRMLDKSEQNMIRDTLNTDIPLTLHSITITPQTPGWEDSDLWRERIYINGKEVMPMENGYKADSDINEHLDDVTPRFTCQREMVRDYAKDSDGYEYWRTTGQLIVTWYNGGKTIIANKDVAINAKVIDCGYDEALPF